MLHLAILWHQHQPVYKNTVRTRALSCMRSMDSWNMILTSQR